MNYYDCEENIIDLLQTVPINEIHFVNPTIQSMMFFSKIYLKSRFRNWINSSGKDMPPPDFYSEKYKCMLEVMRVDDYVIGNNSPNALESRYIKTLENERRQNGLPTFQDSNIRILFIPDMSKASQNGYLTYIENYKRIVDKHLSKINSYYNNHQGYKLGFLIFDEAPGYLRVLENKVNAIPGERIGGYAHYHFLDKNLVDIFLDAEVDFIIWMTPYKNFEGNPKVYPQVCVFDLKRNDKWKKQLIEYKKEEMMCLEV